MRFSCRDLQVALSFALLTVSFSSCAAYSAHYPFRPDDQRAPATTLPPGIRVAAHLSGVMRVPTEGIPFKQYELTIEVEQAIDPSEPWWEPVELKNIRVVDDESREFTAFEVLVSNDSEKQHSGPAASRTSNHYLVIFEVSQAYKFESILHASVHWKLRASGRPPITIRSSFIR